MARTLNDSATRVAEEAMPGWKAVKETSAGGSAEMAAASDYGADDGSPQAEAVMPSLDELKAKYLGARHARPQASDALDVGAEAADTALVEMEAGPLKKTVAVSKSKKKVIWSQG